MKPNPTLGCAMKDLARALWRYVCDLAVFSAHKLSAR